MATNNSTDHQPTQHPIKVVYSGEGSESQPTRISELSRPRAPGEENVTGQIRGWLDKDASEHVNRVTKRPAALFHVVYTKGTLKGMTENLEEHELWESLPDEEVVGTHPFFDFLFLFYLLTWKEEKETKPLIAVTLKH